MTNLRHTLVQLCWKTVLSFIITNPLFLTFDNNFLHDLLTVNKPHSCLNQFRIVFAKIAYCRLFSYSILGISTSQSYSNVRSSCHLSKPTVQLPLSFTALSTIKGRQMVNLQARQSVETTARLEFNIHHLVSIKPWKLLDNALDSCLRDNLAKESMMSKLYLLLLLCYQWGS